MSRRRTIAILAAAALVAALGYSQYWVLRGRVATVEPGRLYRSAELAPGRLLEICRRYRVTTVIDFRENAAELRAEADVLAREGIQHVSLATGQVPSAETVAQFLRVMDARRNEPVLIHCTHGVGRTGVFSAVYRMEYQGWPRWRAIAEAMLVAGFDSFGPDSPKRNFLSGYTPRRSEHTR
jgi:protein tyrosine/serine phosphatase